jgi:hypothetical protein
VRVCEVPDHWEIAVFGARYDVIKGRFGVWGLVMDRVEGTFGFGEWKVTQTMGCMALTIVVFRMTGLYGLIRCFGQCQCNVNGYFCLIESDRLACLFTDGIRDRARYGEKNVGKQEYGGKDPCRLMIFGIGVCFPGSVSQQTGSWSSRQPYRGSRRTYCNKQSQK